MQKRYLLPVTLVTASLLSGCQTFQEEVSHAPQQPVKAKQSQTSMSDRVPASLAKKTHPVSQFAPSDVTPQTTQNTDADLQASDLWHVTRSHLALLDDAQNPAVQTQIRWYQKYPNHMRRLTENAARYYHYILSEVLKRDMPAEIALLPAVESMYNPQAYSSGHAAGIWQIIPSTAKYLGIKRNSWYDGRKDLLDSTRVALDYLESLNKRFDGDWLLTMAAYNAGGGTISKAMRKNREKGKPTDFWSLKLPKETRLYVPRILAIASFVRDPEAYQMDLPQLANKAYFEVVTLPGQIHLAQAANLAGTRLAEVKQLNPGFRKTMSAPSGPHRLLVPIKHSEQLRLALNDQTAKGLRWVSYTVKPGDSLSVIARKFDSRVSEIKKANDLTSSRIRVGKDLLIPQLALVSNEETVVSNQPLQVAASQTTNVKQSAKLNKSTDSKKTAKTNQPSGLNNTAKVKTTSIASTFTSTKPPQSKQLKREANIRQLASGRISQYKVKSGDTLWNIARSYGINIELLARWNNMSTSTPLRVGKMLRIGQLPESIARDEAQALQQIGYRVQNGDSLSTIADRYSVSIADIREWNNIGSRSNLIKPGQSLKIYVE